MCHGHSSFWLEDINCIKYKESYAGLWGRGYCARLTPQTKIRDFCQLPYEGSLGAGEEDAFPTPGPAGHPLPRERALVRIVSRRSRLDMESPGIDDQSFPGLPRKERDKKMKRRLKMFFFDLIIAPQICDFKGYFIK